VTTPIPIATPTGTTPPAAISVSSLFRQRIIDYSYEINALAKRQHNEPASVSVRIHHPPDFTERISNQ
jgi:hypothetical protein